MDYRQSGVDIDAGNETVRRIKSLARATFTPGVLSEIGSFGGLFKLDRDAYREPVLVSSADGVGTKLKVAFLANRHYTVGADLVNHCVNNILVQGVSGTRGGLGYFGLSYYLENQSKLKLIKVDAGAGCVAPSVKTVQSRAYKPLSRALYIYAKRASFERSPVRGFIGYALNNQAAIAKRADYVALTRAQAKRSRFHYTTVLRQVG